jgi:hypothetical protein
MKKLFYLLLTVLISVILISCEKDDMFDTVPTNPNKPNYQSGLVIGKYTSDINSVRSMYNSSIVHSIPSQSYNKSTVDNYVLIEDNNGKIDTLSLSDGASIKITGIDEIYPINKNYLLFYSEQFGSIKLTYEILTHELVTIYDSVHIDSTTNYINVVDTTFVNGEMWLVYYDTIDVVVNIDYKNVIYKNILYNLNDGTFHNINHNIILYNDKIMNSYNEPFYKKSDSTKFYYLNSVYRIIEVDVSKNEPIFKTIFDPTIHDEIFLDFIIVNDNIIYIHPDGLKFKYITKTGKQAELNHDLIWVDNLYGDIGGVLPNYKFVMNDELYIVVEQDNKYNYYKFIYDNQNDSIYITLDRTYNFINNENLSSNRMAEYKYSDDNHIYIFDYGRHNLITISKNDLYIDNIELDIENTPDYNGIELKTKMTKFVNGFIIYTKYAIYSVNINNGSKSSATVNPIASGYTIRTMTTSNDGSVVFYGKNPSGQDIKGVINSDNKIEETLVEYDSNGALITNI